MVLVGDDDGNDVERCRDDWCVGVKSGGWWFDGRAAEGRHCVSLDTDSQTAGSFGEFKIPLDEIAEIAADRPYPLLLRLCLQATRFGYWDPSR